MRKIVYLLSFALFSVPAMCLAGTPCDGIDRSLTQERKAALAPALAKQLKVASVDVFKSFKEGGWSIFYVGTHVSDEPFLFYKGDPMKTHYITTWSGAAGWSEEQEMVDWTVKNVPGIPLHLANCFAWHVTQGYQ